MRVTWTQHLGLYFTRRFRLFFTEINSRRSCRCNVLFQSAVI